MHRYLQKASGFLIHRSNNSFARRQIVDTHEELVKIEDFVSKHRTKLALCCQTAKVHLPGPILSLRIAETKDSVFKGVCMNMWNAMLVPLNADLLPSLHVDYGGVAGKQEPLS